ncbi:MAG: ferredoxin--NADP reductase [Saprospiraceae bacterium]|nr:ferredoxin--NADP reductase [Saprospiraceae bacterium]
MEFYPLTVKAITPETADTVTIEFDIPEERSDIFKYTQGQYVSIKMHLSGHEVRRSYSMSSSPLDNKLAITVKKVEGGQASTYLHDMLKVGDTLEVAHPDGRFFVKLDPEKRRTYYLFGAGSGITPLLSIIKTTLEAEPMSAIFLLYGSRNEESIIFREELDNLSERYTGQLHVEHVLSQPKKEAGTGGLFGMFKKSSTNWKGRMGRIDGRTVNSFLDENFAHGPEQECQYFVCGPGNMAESIKAGLLGRGITPKQIHTEHFVNANHVPGEFNGNETGDKGARLIVHLGGQRIETTVPDGATILDVLVKEKYDPPYSCTAGACSTCMAKVLQGEVTMDVCYALDEDEVKSGYVLTCQSKPRTPMVEITYDF